jgi:hypothetical protein
MTNNVPDKSPTRPKVTPSQYIAIGILLGQWCLLPLTLLLFVIARPFGNTFIDVLPNLLVLQSQYVFLTGDGFAPSVIEAPLRLFEFMIRISVLVVLLRMFSGPLLFRREDLQRIWYEKITSAPIKLFWGWLATSAATWGPGIFKDAIIMFPRLESFCSLRLIGTFVFVP